MNKKFLACLGSVVIIVGCSKKEEVATPPSTNTIPAAVKPSVDIKVPSVDQVTTNVQAATTSVVSNATSTASNVVASAEAKFKDATNVTQSAAVPTNATTTGVLTKLDGFLKPTTNIAIETTPATSAATAQGGGVSALTGGTSLTSLANLSTDQITQGLKEALGKGLQQAVSSLGQPGGFLTNMSVKIPLPDKLQTVEKTLRAVGQGQVADQCITTMNQAAEQAVPAAADVFATSLKSMSVDDAKGILNGPPDAATQFFRRTTQAELTQKFTPIIQQAMAKTGATAAYEQVMAKAKAASPFFNSPSLDLNAYVTGKALDGLFKMVADEEKTIRANPVARTTDVLKSVFGSLQK